MFEFDKKCIEMTVIILALLVAIAIWGSSWDSWGIKHGRMFEKHKKRN
jgi:hypothetical protein